MCIPIDMVTSYVKIYKHIRKLSQIEQKQKETNQHKYQIVGVKWRPLFVELIIE